MPSAKDVIVRPLPAREACEFIDRVHYSGKHTPNTQVHLGAYLGASLEGVMQFGPPLDRRRMVGLIEGGRLRDMLELNRLAFTERLPRNSESRCIAVACRMIRQHAPHVRFVISFADATQCGDGSIYRAAGFLLTQIKPNKSLVRLPDGRVIHEIALMNGPMMPRRELGGRSFFDITGGKYRLGPYIEATGAVVIEGFMLRYIKLLDPTARLTCPVLPYSAIAEAGATMYRGVRGDGVGSQGERSSDGGAPGVQPGGGGSSPTRSLA